MALVALRRLWVGKQSLHDTDVRAEVTLQPTVPSALNPAGLLVVQVAMLPHSRRPASKPGGSLQERIAVMPCSGSVALAVLLALPGSALAARTVALSNDPIAIRLEVHQPTAVVFPEAVAAVPTGADPARLSLDYDGPYLFLQPLEPGVHGRLFVVGASGKLYGLRFTVATPSDDMVTIETPAAASRAKAPSRAVQPLDLLKALRFGTPLPGVTATTLPPFQSPDARVQVLGQQALALDIYLGVVVTITNVHRGAARAGAARRVAPYGAPARDPGVPRWLGAPARHRPESRGGG